MDTKTNLNVINNYLSTVALYLNEINSGVGWENNELTGFSIEWGDVIARIRVLKEFYEKGEMDEVQAEKFKSLQKTFLDSDQNIKALNLVNPFIANKA